MEQTVRLGRIRGIDIGANWSLLVIAWLITWGLADGVLPEAVPGRSTLAYWGVGIFASVLFFASLVLHELSHALVARRHGVEVKRITLWLFGGVAQLESDNPDPATEMRVGVVGPVVSLAIGGFVAVLAAALQPVEPFAIVAASLWWLAAINILLGLFNLAPAFPLDGGRVLRALLWRHWGDRVRATVAAARAGEVVAYVLVLLGVLEITGGALIGGIWFVFLGWFLLSAARAESAVVTRDVLLAGVTAKDVMTPHPMVAPAHLTVERFIDDVLFRHRHSAYPVVDPGGYPVGLVTLDRVRRVDPALRPVTMISTIAHDLAEVPRCQADDALTDVIAALGPSPVGRLLVFDGADLVGILAPGDIVRAIELRQAIRTDRRGGGTATGATPSPPTPSPTSTATS
jgi:Zn-dependent protease